MASSSENQSRSPMSIKLLGRCTLFTHCWKIVVLPSPCTQINFRFLLKTVVAATMVSMAMWHIYQTRMVREERSTASASSLSRSNSKGGQNSSTVPMNETWVCTRAQLKTRREHKAWRDWYVTCHTP